MINVVMWLGLTVLLAVPVFIENKIVRQIGAIIMIVAMVLMLIGFK